MIFEMKEVLHMSAIGVDLDYAAKGKYISEYMYVYTICVEKTKQCDINLYIKCTFCLNFQTDFRRILKYLPKIMAKEV